MENDFAQYSDVLQRLALETVHCCPQNWTQGALRIESDGVRIDYALKNESEDGSAVISELLRDLIDELYVRMAQNGHQWSECVMSYKREGDDVSFDTQFTYAE